jgi:hypothetical protein
VPHRHRHAVTEVLEVLWLLLLSSHRRSIHEEFSKVQQLTLSTTSRWCILTHGRGCKTQFPNIRSHGHGKHAQSLPVSLPQRGFRVPLRGSPASQP